MSTREDYKESQGAGQDEPQSQDAKSLGEPKIDSTTNDGAKQAQADESDDGQGAGSIPQPTLHGASTAWMKEACLSTLGQAPFAELLDRWNPVEEVGLVIRYAFANGQAIQKNKVNQHCHVWEDYANMRFEMVDAKEVYDVLITFDDGCGSWTQVGLTPSESENAKSDRPTMSLACISSEQENATKAERSRIVHAFGHVLGLGHEYAWEDRDLTLTDQAKREMKVHASNAIRSTVNHEKGPLLQRFDPDSIMIHYMPAEMNSSQKGIRCNEELSNTDIALVMVLYPGKIPKGWTVDGAHNILKLEPPISAYLLRQSGDQARVSLLESAIKVNRPYDRVGRSDPEVLAGADQEDDPEVVPGHRAHGPFGWVKGACLHLLQPVHRGERAVAGVESQLWSVGETITYSFMGMPHANQTDKVNKVCKIWEEFANINFVHVDDVASAHLRISFKPNNSYSYVGTDALNTNGKQCTMNLGWITIRPELSGLEKGTILHEFGHALGLQHEHQSPARTQRYQLNVDAVLNYYVTEHGWSREQIFQQVIEPLKLHKTSAFTRYDVSSIMQYPMPRELIIQRDRNHILEIDRNNELSLADKAFIMILYPGRLPAKFGLGDAYNVLEIPFEIHTSAQNPYERNSKALAFLKNQLAEGSAKVKDQLDRRAIVEPKRDRTPPAFDMPAIRDKESGSSWAHKLCVPPPSTGSARERGLATDVNRLWDVGTTVNYAFMANASPVQMRKVEDTFKIWQQYINLDFVRVRNPAQGDLRISFEAGTSYSTLGTLALHRPRSQCTMNLGWITLDPQISDQERGTILHEFGHALGLQHEHQSAARAKVFDLNVRAILDWYKTLFGWPIEQIYREIILPIQYHQTSAMTYYDQFSVMHYPMSEEMIRRADPQNAITGVKENNELSRSDKALIMLLYPGKEGPDMDLNQAYDVLGIPHDMRSAWGSSPKRDASLLAWFKEQHTGQVGSYPQAPQGPGSLQAQMGAPGPANAVGDPTPGPQKPFLRQLVEQLRSIISPSIGQVFTMQFPGRTLQRSEYAWDTEKAGVYAQFSKPIVVNESEFRLVDQMYDVGDIVSGPNGKNLSLVYEQALNNLMPQPISRELFQQQEGARRWLLERQHVEDWIHEILRRKGQDKGTKEPDLADASKLQMSVGSSVRESSSSQLSRIEIARALMEEYLEAKEEWQMRRDRMIAEASKSDDQSSGVRDGISDTEKVARRLAHETSLSEARLSSKFGDAVVQGYLHLVREALAFIDIMGSGERLQLAKDAMRETASSSIDGGLKVYPVKLTPIDWFNGLSTDFTADELIDEPLLLRQQVQDAASRVDDLSTQIALLPSFEQGGNAKILQEAVVNARNKRDIAKSAVTRAYSSNAISAFKMITASAGSLSNAGFAAQHGVNFEEMKQGMGAVDEAERELLQQSRALSESMASLALSRATDTTRQKVILEGQLKAAIKERDTLLAQFNALTDKGEARKPEDNDNATSPEVPAQAGSRWQKISIHRRARRSESSDVASASASASAASANFWIGSYSSSSDSSAADAKTFNANDEFQVDLSFQTTVVTIDRASWFQPQILQQSQSYYRIEKDVNINAWPADVNDVAALRAGLDAEADNPSKPISAALNKSLLPAYPVSFLIAKNVVINLKTSRSKAESFRSQMAADSQTATGVLGFSYSASSNSRSSENRTSLQSSTDGCVIRIPGPQIIGYILQLSEPDRSMPIDSSSKRPAFWEKVNENEVIPQHIPAPTDDKMRAEQRRRLLDVMRRYRSEIGHSSSGFSGMEKDLLDIVDREFDLLSRSLEMA